MSKSYDSSGVGNEIEQLLNDIELRGTSGFMRHAYRNQAFDYAYGVRDKSSEEHPFASVLKQKNEPYFTTTPHTEILKVFIFYEVAKRTHLSFNDFLTLPYPVAVDCIEECKYIAKLMKEQRSDPEDKTSGGSLEQEFFT